MGQSWRNGFSSAGFSRTLKNLLAHRGRADYFILLCSVMQCYAVLCSVMFIVQCYARELKFYGFEVRLSAKCKLETHL